MPPLLLEFLKSYPEDQADALHEFLDGDPEAIEQMLAVLVDHHLFIKVVRG